MPFLKSSRNPLLVCASFPHFIPGFVLDRFGPRRAINLHPSMLPNYRGAAPIQWQIAREESEVGASVQELSRQAFDRGRILAQTPVVSGHVIFRSVGGTENSNPQSFPENVLFDAAEKRLAVASGTLLLSTLRSFQIAQASCKVPPAAFYQRSLTYIWRPGGILRTTCSPRGFPSPENPAGGYACRLGRMDGTDLPRAPSSFFEARTLTEDALARGRAEAHSSTPFRSCSVRISPC